MAAETKHDPQRSFDTHPAAGSRSPCLRFLLMARFPCLLFVAGLFSCSKPPLLAPGPTQKFVAALGAGATEPGGIRIIYGKTSCQSRYPNPIVIPPSRPPTQGSLAVVRWQLSAVPPSPVSVDHNGVTSPPLVALLAATRPLEAGIAAGSPAPGCMLLIQPDMLFVPREGSWLVYDEKRGTVTAYVETGLGSVGSDVYLQLLVGYPDANQLGIISSAGLHLHIGG